MIHATIYTRRGCHLCDEMKDLVERVAQRMPVTIEAIDIDRDPELARLYGLEIPVLLVNGTKVAKHRIGEDELMRALAARA